MGGHSRSSSGSGGRRRRRTRRSASSASSRSAARSVDTLPDYSVEEDKFGRLVNREKRLVWPSQKQLTKKQWKAFLSQDPEQEQTASIDDDQEQKQNPVVQSSECLTFRQKYSPSGQEDEGIFIGSATVTEASEKIGNQGFVLYYRLEKGQVPVQLELWMAYRRNNGSFLHFAVKRRSYRREGNIQEEFYWRVEAKEATKREFTSLAALVKFYRLFSYIDPVSGAIETFPFFE